MRLPLLGGWGRSTDGWLGRGHLGALLDLGCTRVGRDRLREAIDLGGPALGELVGTLALGELRRCLVCHYLDLPFPSILLAFAFTAFFSDAVP